MEITTIKLEKKTKARLDNLRDYKRESYEEIISKILDILNLCRVDPETAQEKLASVGRAKMIEQRKKFIAEKKKMLAERKKIIEERKRAFAERRFEISKTI